MDLLTINTLADAYYQLKGVDYTQKKIISIEADLSFNVGNGTWYHYFNPNNPLNYSTSELNYLMFGEWDFSYYWDLSNNLGDLKYDIWTLYPPSTDSIGMTIVQVKAFTNSIFGRDIKPILGGGLYGAARLITNGNGVIYCHANFSGFACPTVL